MQKEKVGYVDGFVLIVSKDKTEEYKKMSQNAMKVWKKHGAIDYKECLGDDLNPDMGGMEIMTFPKMTNLKENENVWFSYITYKSRAHRDEVNKKVMKEMEEDKEKWEGIPMPFDMKRMSFGGFKVEVNDEE